MSNRLMRKSVMCANSQGVFEPEDKDSSGRVRSARRKIKEPINPRRDSVITYKDDLPNRILTVTVDGVDHELPIDEYSLSLAGRE